MSLLACVGGLLSSASCGGVGEDGPDGGATRDAGRDAAVDARAGGDAGVDGGVDGGGDAGAVEPEWIQLEGLPAGCELSMAADPEAVAGPLRFEPCPDMPGCRQLVSEWRTREPPRLSITQGAHDGEHGYFMFTRTASPYWRWYVIARDDGRIISVIRDMIRSPRPPISCLFDITLSPPNAAVSAWALEEGGFGDLMIGWMRLDEPRSLRVLMELPRTSSSLMHPVVGEGFVAGRLKAGFLRLGFNGSGRWLAWPESGRPRVEAAAGDAVFYGTDPRTGLWVGTGDDAGRLIWAPEEIEVGGIRADGEHLVWSQMSEPLDFRTYDRVELWASPF